MRKNKGFTLIEVMVVLSILAIIAILAYNFFGSTMKEAKTSQAATQLYKDLNALVTAQELYMIKTGASQGAADPADLVTGGYLKALPVVPASFSPDDTARAWNYYNNEDHFGGPTASYDDAWYVPLVKGDICKAFNERYCPACTDGGGGYWDMNLNGGYPQNQQGFCYGYTANLTSQGSIYFIQTYR